MKDLYPYRNKWKCSNKYMLLYLKYLLAYKIAI